MTQQTSSKTQSDTDSLGKLVRDYFSLVDTNYSGLLSSPPVKYKLFQLENKIRSRVNAAPMSAQRIKELT
jgi:hypothetical protein